MAKATRTINGSRVKVTVLEGKVVGIEGPHLSVRIDTVDGAPAGPEHLEHTAWPGTTFENTQPMTYGAAATDRRGRPVPVKLGDPVVFVLDEDEVTFLEIRVNDILTDSHRWS